MMLLAFVNKRSFTFGTRASARAARFSFYKRLRMSTAAKRPKMDKKGKTDKRNYYAKAFSDSRKKFLEAGQCGFMVTCNFREKDCIQESYRLLNECADELYGKADDAQEKKPTAGQGGDDDDGEEEVDISVQVQNQAEAVKKQRPQYRFQSVETGAKNCCFITTTLKDPKDVALKILRELNETKKSKSRNILRLMPIEVVTKANLKDIIDASGALFDKYFLKEPKTFAIIFNKRFNNNVERTEVIEELAGLVASKNMHNKANLKNPELAIIVEVVKGLCLISVVPEYFQLRKYNMVEICAQRDEDNKEKVESEKKDDATNASECKVNDEQEESPEVKVDETKENQEDDEEKATESSGSLENQTSEVKSDEKQEEDKSEDDPVAAAVESTEQ